MSHSPSPRDATLDGHIIHGAANKEKNGGWGSFAERLGHKISNRGIKTGYDKAFLIDDVNQKSSSWQRVPRIGSDIIKTVSCVVEEHSVVISAPWVGLWLIDAHNGYGDVPAVNINRYSVVKNHLAGFYPQLKKRHDKGKTPYNLRNCAYYKEFSNQKIVWGNLNKQAKFAYAPEGTFITAPATMLTPYSPFLLAALNSTLLDWYFRLIGVERDGGYFEYKPMFIERLPIPKISAAEQRPFIRLVNDILKAKESDTNPDTSGQEREIDRLVYELYGLTEEEVAAVERNMGLIHASDEEEDAALARAIEAGLASYPVGSAEVMAVLRDPDGDSC